MQLAVISTTTNVPHEDLREFAKDIRVGIREYLAQRTRGSGRTAESIRAYVHGKEIVISSDVPYAKSLDQGTHTSRTMWELINRVIPLKLKGGKVIFRRVTLESLRNGKWRVGPKEGIDFVKHGVDIARARGTVKGTVAFQIKKPKI